MHEVQILTLALALTIFAFGLIMNVVRAPREEIDVQQRVLIFVMAGASAAISFACGAWR